jgi:antitoxin (DNA-binding transcriptional repressor) of toxin-antitoxin stability system
VIHSTRILDYDPNTARTPLESVLTYGALEQSASPTARVVTIFVSSRTITARPIQQTRDAKSPKEGMIEGMAVLHITKGELARDVHGVLEKVRAGAEVVIEEDTHPVAVLRAAESRRRKLSEIAASLPEHSTATIDPDFAADVREFIDRHPEPVDAPE